MTMLRLQQNVLSHCYNFVIKMLKLKKIKKIMDKKHCFTPGLTKVIILLVICDISFCYNFVMKMFVIWPCFLVHTFKTSRLKSLTTSSRVPHYLVQVPRKCIQCYWAIRWWKGRIIILRKQYPIISAPLLSSLWPWFVTSPFYPPISMMRTDR